MKKAVYFSSILLGTLLAAPASAYPSFRSSAGGSSLYIYVSNPEDRAYNCTVTYEWAYDSYGETKTGSESVNVNVAAKQGEVEAHRFSGSYPHLRFTNGPTPQCNPA